MKTVLSLGAILVASAGVAAQRASDVVYVPAAAHAQGVDFFQTDVVVTNAFERAARVTLLFLPTGDGHQDNRGGESRVVRERLPAGGTIVLEDVLRTTFALDTAVGALVVFGCDGDETCQEVGADGVPIGAAPLLVRSRTYAVVGGEGGTSTLGQAIPGIPFYDAGDADPSGSSERSVLILGGLEESTGDATTARFRTNVGFLNGASDWITTLAVDVLDEAGALVTTTELELGPLAHTQANRFLGALGLADGTPYTLRVRAAKNELASGATIENAGPPAILAYASTIDEATADPTFVEAGFPASFECVRRSSRSLRPLAHPNRD